MFHAWLGDILGLQFSNSPLNSSLLTGVENRPFRGRGQATSINVIMLVLVVDMGFLFSNSPIYSSTFVCFALTMSMYQSIGIDGKLVCSSATTQSLSRYTVCTLNLYNVFSCLL